MRLIDLAGRRFGRVLVIERAPDHRPGRPRWVCQCDCGKQTTILGASLRTGKTVSCGCLRIEAITTHGGTHSPEYVVWWAMKQRCESPQHGQFRDWGGRGIRILYPSFEAFLADVGPRPTPRHTIERIDNDSHYAPGNCRWATRKEQAANRRPPSPRKRSTS